MERFIHEENLKLYRKLIDEAKDEAQKARLIKLLAEEQSKANPPSSNKPYTE